MAHSGSRYSTGIGSLPFGDAEAAVRHVFTHYDVPFFPQLPQLAPTPTWDPRALALAPMLREILTPPMLAALRRRDAHALVGALEDATRVPELATDCLIRLPGFESFRLQAAGRPRLKTQIVGPLTALALLDRAVVPAPTLRPALWAWITTLTRAWRKLLAPLAPQATILWDDALLLTQATPKERGAFAQLAEETKLNGGQLGIHTCAPGKLLPMIEAWPTALLAVDLHVVDVSAATAAAARHAQGPGFIFGVVDTRSRSIDEEEVRDKLQLTRDLAGDAPVLISGGCGTGLHTVAYEQNVAQALRLARA